MKYVAYYRVSTNRQGKSHLGLDAQRASVMQHCNGQVAAEFTEVESGKRSDRPELAKAIARARALRATLIVARLDRLARNVKFVATLMDSGVEFTAADIPQANRLTLHIVAAVAEAEGRAISERTKLALAQAKKRGKRLGTRRRGHLQKINWRKGQRNGLHKAVAVAAANRAQQRADCYAELGIDTMRREGLSFAAIAERLNQAGHVTTTGKQFSAMTVHRLLAS